MNSNLFRLNRRPFLLLPALLLLCAPPSLFAQLDSFNLASYKLPDIKTHRLDFNLSGDGSGNAEWEKNNKNLTSNPKTSNYNTRLATDYNFYRNSAKYQGEQDVSLVVSANMLRNSQGRTRAINYNLSANSVNRSYFNPRRFLEYDLILNSNHNKYISWSNDGSSEGIINQYSRVEVPVLFGTGRIEQVQDARLAVYILQDLQKAGLISRVPEQEEILEFARLISQAKGKRFFDSRHKMIWEIETVDAWVKSKNILTSADAAYFTRLYDNWLYAAGPVRESGKRFSAGLVSSMITQNYYPFKPDSIVRHPVNNQFYLSTVIRHEKTKPVNLYWQTGHLLELTGYIIQANYFGGSPEAKDREAYISGTVQYSAGWYPNSRTNIDMNASLDGFIGTGIAKGSSGLQYGLSPSVGLVAGYYFSPQLRANLNYKGSYGLSGNDNGTGVDPLTRYHSYHHLNHFFNLNITYSLF